MWIKTFGFLRCFFSQTFKHSTDRKKGKVKIENKRWIDRTDSNPKCNFFALYPTLICPHPTLCWTGPNSADVYFESFLTLWSSPAKFSSIATRFSFIVCWTWWEEREQVKEEERKQNLGKSFNVYKTGGKSREKWWFKVRWENMRMYRRCMEGKEWVWIKKKNQCWLSLC